jgi:PAS domain-containing protein
MEHQLEAISSGQMSKEELFDFIESFPALLWRIDIVGNRIEYLNNHSVRGLGRKSGLLLQNIEFRDQTVVSEDLALLEQFMTSVKNGETAATIFRIKTQDNEIVWIKVTGVACRRNPRYYLGFMLDVTDTSEIVQSISEQDAEFMAMIEMVDNPVVLVNPQDKTIIASNAAARDVFLCKPDELSRMVFSDLYHPSMENHISRIYEALIFEKKWEGRLIFQRKRGSAFSGDVVMRHLFCKGMRLFRVSIHNIAMNDGRPEVPLTDAMPPSLPGEQQYKQFSDALVKQIGAKSDMALILQTILDHQGPGCHFDAILYSDIYIKKKKVVVYTAGEAFAAMEQGQDFSYEGTIAENIDRFKLDYLIVDDTFASIKAIDWALFIPNGIRSYYAMPFYERNVMRTVLIFCSRKRNVFTPQDANAYAVHYKAFLHGLSNWRKALRSGKKKSTGRS